MLQISDIKRIKVAPYGFVLLFILVGCKDKDPEPEFTPTEVLVGIKTEYTIEEVFAFINQIDLPVESIWYSNYTSSLPSDSLQYVLDYLNTRSYTNRPNSHVSGYLHFQTNVIYVFPTLYQVNDKNNQRDWLECIKKMKLVEITDTITGKSLHFHVPQGTEKKWVKRFQQMEMVNWAELNYCCTMPL
jgi:hypothetical protein